MVDIAGLISVIIFYLLILAVGIWAGRKNKPKDGKPASSEDVMLAGRNIGLFVGIFTMIGKQISWTYSFVFARYRWHKTEMREKLN